MHIISSLGQNKTISSIELVEIINELREPGKAELRHDHFMAKCLKVLGELNTPKFRGITKVSFGRNGQTRDAVVYNLPRREACLMVMSESYKVQARVFDRMDELEQAIKPKTMGEQLLQQAQMFVELERRQMAIEAEAVKINQRLDNIQTATEYFTVVGYHVFRGLGKVSIRQASAVGNAASKLSKKYGVTVGKTPDPRFGMVNTYLLEILDETMDLLAS